MNSNIKKTITIGLVIFMTLSCVQRDADFYFQRGTNQFRNNNYELALSYFTKALAIDSTFVLAYFGKGMTYGRLGKHELAIIDFTRAIALNSENADIYLSRGMSHDRLGKHELAIIDFTSALKLINDNNRRSILYFHRGMNYLSLNEYDKAISDFKSAIEFNPESIVAYWELVGIYDNQENWYMSAKYVNKIISIDPLNARAHFLRGVQLTNLNRYKEAFEDFNTAIYLGYSSEKLYFILGGLHGILGDFEASLQTINKGIEMHPNSGMLFLARGVLYSRLNNIENTIADYKRAAELGNEEARWILREDFGIEEW